jgi:class 3 adenylate cyclase
VAPCPSCLKELPGEFAFCPFCGAALVTPPPAREQRKTVTVLFCDVTGSTELGEQTDPEALRALLARYFQRMKAIVESHGGTVEKFIGDAVMAVFGIPQLHEDDALRACRAAEEMRAALPALGVQARIGINTGEVVTGTSERLATGDAVNVAARLEQAAEPGDVLVGAETLRLVRSAVEVERLEPVALKGKAEPVPAYRLVAVHDPNDRSASAAMVGRERELRGLRDAFERAVADRSCQLFTVLGAAGVGKSRLVYEFSKDLDATIVRSRCLSYGEGITYWPVVDVLKQLPERELDPAASQALASVLGAETVATSSDEIAWAFRKFLEAVAQDGPLVVVFDDLHWAEPTFLDLVEHVSELSRDAPILILCMARPELVDERAGWGGGKLNASTILLEPLSIEETDVLLGRLGGPTDELRSKILEAAEGNPLFVEEMLTLVRESGDEEVAVPPTIQALIAARLDQLETSERAVLERGAVEGRLFHRGAVQELGREEERLTARLTELVRKELIRPDKAQLKGEDAYRFRHLLIRDAAYEAMPKATRADHHERFARWFETHGAELVELDEIVGHHLEQAVRYKQDLGQPDLDLAERAGARIAAAGRRALWRGDHHAAVSLLERALELSRPLGLDVQLELDLADALREQPLLAAEVASAAAVRAADAGEDTAAALARAVAAMFRSAAGEQTVDEVEMLARAALPLLEDAHEFAGLTRLHSALGLVANTRGRWEDWAREAEQAVRYARLAGQSDENLFGLGSALAEGPRPADEALSTLDTYLPESARLGRRAELLAQLGRFSEAWSLAREENERLVDLNGSHNGDHALAAIAVLEGNHEAAAFHLRRLCDFLEEHHQRAVLSTHVAELGHELCRLGRHDEAEPLVRLSRELGDEQDLVTQVAWRQTDALVRAGRHQYPEAEQVAREAVAISDRTDLVNLQAGCRRDLAEILASTGRTDEAAAELDEALHRYERKKNVAMLTHVRSQLAALRERHQVGM